MSVLSAQELTSNPGLGEVPAHPNALLEVCGWPDVGPMLAGCRVALDPRLASPFEVAGDTIWLRPESIDSVSSAAATIREALELRALMSARPDASPAERLAHRVLARATAATYQYTGLLVDLDGSGSIAEPATDADVAALGDGRLDVAGARRLARRLLGELGADQVNGLAIEFDVESVEIASRAMPLSPPTEILLAQGGDHRQVIDWSTGQNSYGMQMRPTPWVASFSSCTASSPSSAAYEAAGALRLRLLVASLDDRLGSEIEKVSDQIRYTLKLVLGLDPDDDTAIVFTPSGTDAEFVALAAAVAGTSGFVTNIVVAASEIGSGSLPAASGLHFGNRTAAGQPATIGEPIGDLFGGRVVVETVPVRDQLGVLLAPEDVEALAELLIGRAIEAGHRVLLHVLEGSKTGIRLPRPHRVLDWQRRWEDRIDVVVDAAQMRVDQRTSISHLAVNWMVFVTGSKFYAGPPFSGAVLLPAPIAHRLSAASLDGSGLSAFLDETAVPHELHGLRRCARPGANVGLTLRWHAALTEMRAFHSVSTGIRDDLLRHFARTMLSAIASNPTVELVPSPYTGTVEDDHRGFDDLPTIFTFVVKDADGRPLPMDIARSVHRMLPNDLSSDLPPSATVEERSLAGRSFQVGQPVAIGEGRFERGALRIAVGAPTISRVVFDHTRGRNWRERLDREVGDAADAIAKLGLIAKYWPWPASAQS